MTAKSEILDLLGATSISQVHVFSAICVLIDETRELKEIMKKKK